MGLLDQDPTEEDIQNSIDVELATNFTVNILELNITDLMDFGKKQDFSLENWEQLLFFIHGYHIKYPNRINDCKEKLLAIYNHLQKNGGTISFEILSIIGRL